MGAPGEEGESGETVCQKITSHIFHYMMSKTVEGIVIRKAIYIRIFL